MIVPVQLVIIMARLLIYGVPLLFWKNNCFQYLIKHINTLLR